MAHTDHTAQLRAALTPSRHTGQHSNHHHAPSVHTPYDSNALVTFGVHPHVIEVSGEMPHILSSIAEWSEYCFANGRLQPPKGRKSVQVDGSRS
mgnify:CR=1 FL=1